MSSKKMKFDKVTIVTGGSKGIGEGCARVFCQAGAKVVICARGKEAGKATAKVLNQKGPGSCLFIQCDVSIPDQIQELINQTVKQFGRIDCLINNAGWHPPFVPIDEFSIADFNGLLQTNLVSVFAACKFALPHLRKTRGSIINVSSLVGIVGDGGACTYVATKAGIIGLTQSLAIDEAKYNVRVNAICPASVGTQLTYNHIERSENPKEMRKILERWHWLNRLATIEEIGQACLFLASDQASFITGVALPVSGGAELGYGQKATG